MQTASYPLQIQNDNMRKAVTAWLMLGLASLVGAGIFSILLVLARTPAIQQVTPLIDFFRIALVVHVNLSVVIWLLSMAGVFWSLGSPQATGLGPCFVFACSAWNRHRRYCSVCRGLRPLDEQLCTPVTSPGFLPGLILFTAGIASHLLRSLLSLRKP